jgi:hypothetical protein
MHHYFSPPILEKQRLTAAHKQDRLYVPLILSTHDRLGDSPVDPINSYDMYPGLYKSTNGRRGEADK